MPPSGCGFSPFTPTHPKALPDSTARKQCFPARVPPQLRVQTDWPPKECVQYFLKLLILPCRPLCGPQPQTPPRQVQKWYSKYRSLSKASTVGKCCFLCFALGFSRALVSSLFTHFWQHPLFVSAWPQDFQIFQTFQQHLVTVIAFDSKNQGFYQLLKSCSLFRALHYRVTKLSLNIKPNLWLLCWLMQGK